MGGCGPKVHQRSMTTVASIFMYLHVKCPIFSAKDDEDTES